MPELCPLKVEMSLKDSLNCQLLGLEHRALTGSALLCQQPKVTSFDLSKTPAGDYQVPGLGAITGKSFIRLHDILKLIITKNFFYQNINKGSCTILLVGFPN